MRLASRAFAPPWGRSGGESPVRGRAALTRGYRVVRPLWGRQPRRHPIAPPTRRGCLRRSAIPGAHTAARTTRKGRMPRRDYRPKESRLYASKFPCGTMFAAVRSHTTRQAPLSWANYPITTGKRSAPRLLRTFGALRCYGILPADVFLCLSAFLSCGLDGGLWRPSCARTRMYIAVPADTCEGMGGARCLGARNRVAWGCLWLRKAEKQQEITYFSITPPD